MTGELSMPGVERARRDVDIEARVDHVVGISEDRPCPMLAYPRSCMVTLDRRASP